jgi:hypothetical protein
MYVKDHPPAHFHAIYGEHQARVSIATGDVIDGKLPLRAARLVREWTELRRADLEENWQRVEAQLRPQRVEPLP